MLKKIKVMTYNICHGMDYSDAKSLNWVRDFWNIHLEKNAETIKNVNPDIVGLNEVYNDGEELLKNQTQKIADFSKYDYSCFAEAIKFEHNRSYGNAFLSKYPILEMQSIPVLAPTENEKRIDENLWYEDRVVLRAVIDIGQPIAVFVTHFGLNRQEMERMQKVLVDCIDREKNPIILMGDFNVEPSDNILLPIFERLTSVAKECGNVQKTFATYEDKLQIDYIFVSKEFSIKSFSRIESNVSDHYPCIAELEILK